MNMYKKPNGLQENILDFTGLSKMDSSKEDRKVICLHEECFHLDCSDCWEYYGLAYECLDVISKHQTFYIEDNAFNMVERLNELRNYFMEKLKKLDNGCHVCRCELCGWIRDAASFLTNFDGCHNDLHKVSV